MKNGGEKGEFIEWLLMFCALSVVIFAILIPKTGLNPFGSFPLPGGGGNWLSTTWDIVPSDYQSEPVSGTVYGPSTVSAPVATSIYRESVSIGLGNASYADNPDEEYITIENNGRANVNITGWQLRNAKDKRLVEVGGQLRSYASDTATIGKAAVLLSPAGRSQLGDIVLKPGESAVINTGKIGVKIPYEITSFKLNKCAGYLGDLERYYTFTPSMPQQCPAPRDEPGIGSVSIKCREFIENMSSCHNPDIGSVINGDECRNCVDGNSELGSSCVAFIKAHYGYAGCVANHISDPDFYGRSWRIFLGRPWEMWAERYETVSLYDNNGRLVASASY